MSLFVVIITVLISVVVITTLEIIDGREKQAIKDNPIKIIFPLVPIREEIKQLKEEIEQIKKEMKGLH